MKKFISRIRNKRLKGNVSLLVIFILLASSVIALLSINQIQHLLTYGNMTFNYFRAFYLAKAGTELGLTEVYYREAGFEHNIGSGDSVVSENFGSYSGFDLYFTMDVSGKFQHLTNDVRYTKNGDCSGHKIVLGTGEGIVLSLFEDTTNGIANNITGTNENNIIKFPDDNIRYLRMEDVEWENSTPKELTFGLFNYDADGNMGDIIVKQKQTSDLSSFLNQINNISGKRRYLTIKNPWTGNETVSFCISMGNNENNLIPYSDSLITVRGNYGNMEVGLQSVVKKTAPSWSLNVLGGVE